MARLLNVKQMVDSMMECSDDSEFTALWNAFLTLRAHCFISDHDWDRFYDNAHDLYYDEEYCEVRHSCV